MDYLSSFFKKNYFLKRIFSIFLQKKKITYSYFPFWFKRNIVLIIIVENCYIIHRLNRPKYHPVPNGRLVHRIEYFQLHSCFIVPFEP